MKPRLLDLFCGAGGCTKGYQRTGFYVVGVDIADQPRYCGDFFYRGDALSFMRSLFDDGSFATFDAIHASPPCQGYSALGGDHPLLIEATRELLNATGLPYVIENIPDAAWTLQDPVLICGSMFDPPLIDRHRLFETNWGLRHPEWPCRHKMAWPRFPVYEHGRTTYRRWPAVYGTGGGKSRERWGEVMEIDWMTDAELTEAIPPRFTEFIGAQLLAHIAATVTA